MGRPEVELIAHLVRRAGFGATPDELDEYVARGYDAVVEELLYPSEPVTLPDDLIRRYNVALYEPRNRGGGAAYWLYRMICTRCPLEEKLVLFWHGLFATSATKLNQGRAPRNQIDTFRRNAFGHFNNMLVDLSRDPAMIIWLDNQDNHRGSINENYGRELLELFSMGIGNYSEEDIKNCARAFTGWTVANAPYMSMKAAKNSIWPYNSNGWHFEYREDDHDDGVKTFLGQEGCFNGEDIVDIIVAQEPTARFVCTRLFRFFVADNVDEGGEQVISAMMQTYFESDYEIRAVLRTMFQSDYFKSEQARYTRVKGPVELLVGAVRLAGTYRPPAQGIEELVNQTLYMGQGLCEPPSVEGWHEGIEWIDSGVLVERVNFVSKQLGNPKNPGVRDLITRLADSNNGVYSPEDLVDRCLELLGPMQVSDRTRTALIKAASRQGELNLADHQAGDENEERVANMFRLATSTREYQFS
jgi:hypothetical protein